MTPEQLDHAAEECAKAIEELWFVKRDGRSKAAISFLKKIVVFAKAAIPSGEVAEDRDLIVAHVSHECADGQSSVTCRGCQMSAAAGRLSAQAQSAENYRGMWIDAERGRMALLAERDEFKRQRDARERDLMLHSEAKNELLREVTTLRKNLSDAHGELRALFGRKITGLEKEIPDGAPRLSAAGQVLSEHVDKAPECDGEPDCGWHNGGPCRACKGAPEWTMRDEFAKAAMHTVVVACKGEIDEGILKFADVARRAYRLADAMIAEGEKR